MDDLEEIKEFLYQNNDFVMQNQRGNRMYSSSLNNYLEFAQGENFVNVKDNIMCLDIEMPVEDSREYAHKACSLDVYANIICLCPICHRLLHYGLKAILQSH